MVQLMHFYSQKRKGHHHMAGTIFPSTSRHQDSDGWQPRLFFRFFSLSLLLFLKEKCTNAEECKHQPFVFPLHFLRRGSDVG